MREVLYKTAQERYMGANNACFSRISLPCIKIRNGMIYFQYDYRAVIFPAAVSFYGWQIKVRWGFFRLYLFIGLFQILLGFSKLFYFIFETKNPHR